MSERENSQFGQSLKARMTAGQVALGMVIRLSRTGDIARIAKSSGHDFIFIDAQHAMFTLERISDIVQTALGCGIVPLVRVRSCRDPNVPVILDGGAAGIVFPDVNTAAEARHGVLTTRFAPIGRRSVTSTYPAFDYRPTPLHEVMQRLNDYTLLVCMIETVEGLENVEEIAAIEGVDVLLVGLADLLVDMGKPEALSDPAALQAVERVAAAARAHGKIVGVGGDADMTRQEAFIRLGVRFIPTRTDDGFLITEASRFVRSLRDAEASAAR
jgi:staphyloferrin B biosynthesis citrate synthase